MRDFDANKAIDRIVRWIRDYFIKNGPEAYAVLGISGGKDSTVAAMLCVKALGANRVFGVLMPNGEQHDIGDSEEIVDLLGIDNAIINIGPITSALYNAIGVTNEQVQTNAPARIRMTTLYSVAAVLNGGGRIVNTCNLSENVLGWSTKFGDHAGDFAPLHDFTCTEVVEMGRVLAAEFGIPTCHIEKTPSDGMCGSSDEEKFGFTYAVLDAFIRDRVLPADFTVHSKIIQMYNRNKHKLAYMPYPRSGKGCGIDSEVPWEF